MNNSEIKDLQSIDTWFVGNTTEKADRVIVKRYENKKFIESYIIPSSYYPLSREYQVFNYTNTHQIGLVEDEMPIIDIFNSIKEKVGMCYYNAEALTNALCAAGYDAETFVGWLMANGGSPIHHAWTVLNVNERPSVLDLSDHHAMASQYYYQCNSLEEERKMVVAAEKKIAKLPNHEKCFPVGIPAPIWYYVGCKSDKDEGINLYRDLCSKYPNHPSAPKTASGMSKTQAMLMK